MSELQIRRIDWRFDPETTPFVWNEAEPEFSRVANAVSFLAPPLERYIVAVMRRAMEQLDDDDPAAEEARLFLRQEALHARAHRGHVAALVGRYPALAETVEEMNRSFDEHLGRDNLRYHLAFVAGLEATFTPLFRAMLDREEQLFAPGDDRVASLFLWHFVEEIEHRASAITVYRALVPDALPALLGPDAFDFSEVPDPHVQEVPEFVRRWVEAYERGVDVREWYAASGS